MAVTEIRAIPGPGFVAGTVVTTWLDSTAAGNVAWLLIGHPGPQRPSETAESIETGLLGMVDALRLRPASERVTSIGDRLLLPGRITVLDYGHPVYSMRIPTPGARWREHLARGGNALLVIGLDPIPPGAAQDGVDAYLRQAGERGRLMMGATGARGR